MGQMEFEEIRAIMDLIDANGDGALTAEELIDAMQNEKIEHALREHGIEIKDPDLFFQTLLAMSLDPSSGSIDINEFVHYAMQTKGPASALVVQSLVLGTKTLEGQIQAMQNSVLSRVESWPEKVGTLDNSQRGSRRINEPSLFGEGSDRSNSRWP